MAIRRIYETPDPVLRQISKPVETFDAELKTLVEDMFETMYDAPGIGLAAVQVGVPIRLLVIDLQEPEEEGGEPVRDPKVFINPEVIWHSDSEVPYTEGCLSVPEQYAEVMRPDRIRARWRDVEGNQFEEEIDGLLAVCLQHEMDHLNGTLYLDRLDVRWARKARKVVRANGWGKPGASWLPGVDPDPFGHDQDPAEAASSNAADERSEANGRTAPLSPW